MAHLAMFANGRLDYFDFVVRLFQFMEGNIALLILRATLKLRFHSKVQIQKTDAGLVLAWFQICICFQLNSLDYYCDVLRVGGSTLRSGTRLAIHRQVPSGSGLLTERQEKFSRSGIPSRQLCVCVRIHHIPLQTIEEVGYYWVSL